MTHYYYYYYYHYYYLNHYTLQILLYTAIVVVNGREPYTSSHPPLLLLLPVVPLTITTASSVISHHLRRTCDDTVCWHQKSFVTSCSPAALSPLFYARIFTVRFVCAPIVFTRAQTLLRPVPAPLLLRNDNSLLRYLVTAACEHRTVTRASPCCTSAVHTRSSTAIIAADASSSRSATYRRWPGLDDVPGSQRAARN